MISRASNRQHWREPSAAGSEIRRLSLVKACGGKKDFAIVHIQPHVNLAGNSNAVNLDETLARWREVLGHVAASRYLVPDPLRHLIAAIDGLASVTSGKVLTAQEIERLLQ